MGPIEKELRGISWPVKLFWVTRVSDAALDFCIETAVAMGLECVFLGMSKYDDDVLSEAIEAAEAFGA